MLKTKKTFALIYILGFLWALARVLPHYAQSSFLEQFVSIKYVGLYLVAATLVALVVIYIFPRFIKKYTNYKTTILLLFIYVINIFLLIHADSAWNVLIFFIVNYVSLTLLSINLDIFLKDISEGKRTGKIRTTFLTVLNGAAILTPLLMGYLIGDDDRYWLVYLVAGIVMIPAIFILFIEKENLSDHERYKNRGWKKLLKEFRKNRNLTKIFQVAFSLRFFYAVMVLYTPIYLHEHIGFSWEQLGIIFTIMLLPFVIFELPAGNLADKKLGEKEILITGLVMMIIFTGLIFFVQSAGMMLWMAILFATRIGASLVEAMHEVYFFKIVNKHDTDIIYIFRDLRPGGWLVGSLASVLVLMYLPIQYLFIMLALVLFLALFPAITLKDTK